MPKRISLRAHRLGCRLLDRDHEILFRLVNRIDTAVRESEPGSLTGITIALDAYFDAHLENEEDLMRTWEYPDLEEHRQEHARMQAQMRELGAAIREGHIELAATALEIVKQWLCDHIGQTDRKLARFLRERHIPRKIARAASERPPAAGPWDNGQAPSPTC